MKKIKVFPLILGVFAAAAVFAVGFFALCVSLNVHNPGVWILADVCLLAFIFVYRSASGKKDFGWETVRQKRGSKKAPKKTVRFRFSPKYYILPAVLLGVIIVISVVGCEELNARSYAGILQIKSSDFAADLSETVGTDSIALMDTASARMLGDREIGTLSDVVSQFNVSDDYTQIDHQGKPVKVAALRYAGFFKWMSNKNDGVKGYVTVDPVSMSASFRTCEGMRYVPSAWFFQNAYRHLRMQYPTVMFENLHFEIDESGKPYYVASVIEKTVALFGGKTVCGCIVLDPVTGESALYGLNDVPRWVDVVFNGDLICMQYNWYGTLRNGYLNSLFAKKGCQRVTTYSPQEDEDDAPVSDYGYVAKDGDIWIYTGVTSVNGDNSNIGFLLSNERTGESRYYAIAGADEKSAMTAAEGEVQEKGYQASFPSLINIDGAPTYIMVLKDSGGLVKLYAAVNVEQYNIVATAPEQNACIEKYKALLGIRPQDAEEQTITVTVADIRYIDIEGNTYIYLIGEDHTLYKAKAADYEDLLFVQPGDTLTLICAGNEIRSFEQQH